ncbi:MAG: peptide ABC transporter substrate-binding protein [Candidatus Eremiobacteraeota bacterium]|nr:peptide ABC transporter substrate-binding protein [Candidatus Eremiobacteraeota bacterium]
MSAMCALLVAACTHVETARTGASLSAGSGVLRIVGLGSIQNLVPELSNSASTIDPAMNWAAWFYFINAQGELEPELATDVPTLRNGGISKDGLAITYHLRRGVVWHDGAPFDARDVIFTWHVIMNPANDVTTRSGYDDIAAMSAPDPHTVVLRLKRPYAPAVATFFAAGGGALPYCVLPEHLLAKLPDINHAAYDSKPVGTGPFSVDRYEPGSVLILKANPRYWRGAPKLAEIHWLIVPDTNTRMVMLRTGEADLFYLAANNVATQLKGISGIHLVQKTMNSFVYLSFNLKHPPLDDVRVRRAIAMGVDRDRIIRDVLRGDGEPANGDQPSFSWAFDPKSRAPAYDPARAARLLDAAGWRLGPDGYRHKDAKRLSLVFVYWTTGTDPVRFAPIFQSAMRDLGVDISIKTFPDNLYFAPMAGGGILTNGKYDIAWNGWYGGIDPDDSTLWACDQRPPAGNNFSFFCDPRVDAQERIALLSYDRTVRQKAYFEIQRLLNAEVPADFLYWSRSNNAMRDGFAGFEPAPAGSVIWNSWQWSI